MESVVRLTNVNSSSIKSLWLLLQTLDCTKDTMLSLSIRLSTKTVISNGVQEKIAQTPFSAMSPIVKMICYSIQSDGPL